MVDLQKFENAHYLTVTEVALAMRVSKMTVYRLLHAGELPAVRFGRSYRVPEEAMEEYLAAEQYTAAAPAPAVNPLPSPQQTGPAQVAKSGPASPLLP